MSENTPYIRAATAEEEATGFQAGLEKADSFKREAINQIARLSRELGEMQGRLEASELPGVVDGWRERAEKAERERDEAEERNGHNFEAAQKYYGQLLVCQARADRLASIVRGLVEAGAVAGAVMCRARDETYAHFSDDNHVVLTNQLEASIAALSTAVEAAKKEMGCEQ